MKLPGFFPTPRPVISRMLELAGIEDGDRVLEPSAGKGDILDMIREQHPGASVTAIERNQTLFDVLEAKGHEVSWSDFLEYSGEHDVVVMNPPFEKGESYYLLCVGDASSSGLSCDCGLFLNHGDAQLVYQLYVGDSVGHAAEATGERHVAGLERRQKKVAQSPVTR
jgi:hypothetical protein